MTKARDLADLIAAGNPLADGAISVAEISDLTASAADLNTTDVTTLGTVEASKVVTADGSGNVTSTGNIYLGDFAGVILGSGQDLSISHDGTNSYINELGAGDLVIQTNGSKIGLASSSPFEWMVEAVTNGAVSLSYDGSAKLATTATGIDVTGNATFADNGKALFGAGSDLQIYHDGSNSVIADVGPGAIITYSSDFIIQQNGSNERMADFAQNGAVRLYHDGAVKLSTASSGADVTGEFIADSYNETYSALSGTSPAVNCHNGNSFSLVLSGATTFTFTNPPASGTAYTFSVEIIQDSGASGYSVTWPTSVDWPAATAPTLTATASAKDIFVFTTRDGGTNWYGFTAGQALA